MKTFAKTLTLDTRFGHLYRPLARNLIIIVIIIFVIMAAVLFYFDNHQVNMLSEEVIESNALATDEKIHDLFDAADRGLRIAQRQLQSLDFGSPNQQRQVFAQLSPFLKEYDFLDSINIADSAGDEYALIKQLAETLTRHISSQDSKLANWRRWVDSKIVEEWTRQNAVSPKERVWFQTALSHEAGAVTWTLPYQFLTTKDPGISVTTRWRRPGSDEDFVAAFNITLIDLSRYTTRLRPTEHGLTVIFDQDGKTLGLPPDKRFEDDKGLISAILSPVSELNLPPLNSALDAWEANSRNPGIFAFRTMDQEWWWAGFSVIKIDDDQQIWSGTIIPQDDILGSLAKFRNLALAGVGLLGLVFAGGVFAASMRAIRRQMRQAVEQLERELGQYRLQQKIGEGGNGVVYLAKHALLRRPTAVKLMNPEFARSEKARKRFEHEVQVTSTLSHPNTVAIYDYGQTPDGTLYYVMELLTGITLSHLVRVSGPLPPGRVIFILEQIAGSLVEAHAKGLIHRDIKPSNILLCERGGLFDVVKVLDFGLVKETVDISDEMSHDDVLIGTPLFMAPEIISRPEDTSPQSDLYALGAVGYYLLTAHYVFEGESAVDICAKHLHDSPMRPSQRVDLPIPTDLEAVIMACLQKDPSLRPASAEELKQCLLQCRDAGSWGAEDALKWWRTNGATFTGNTSVQEEPPMSQTELLVDLDDRLSSPEKSDLNH